MSAPITIKGRLRTAEEQGKNPCYRLRAQGELPGNLMNEAKATAIALDPKFLSVAWKDGKRFNLDIEGTVKLVTIKELQIDHVKRSPLHVDLMYA
ncbi:MAG: hypothetical protein HYW48_05665 [Deltaproteobacteria bacterium]|nr:hypothetical protein [Deltaproteobacteria bacterium]